MSKWLGGLISALVLLALSSLLGAALKGPIDDWASRDRLKAEVQLAPWFEKPSTALKNDSKGDSELIALLASLRSPSTGSDFGVARVIVKNESKKTITNANFRIDKPWDVEEGIIIDSQGKTTSISKTDRVILPDLKPGDIVTAYIWDDGYSSLNFPDGFKTYSSEGSFRVTYDWPTSQIEGYESGISRFLDDYAGWGIGLSILFLFVIGIYIIAVNDAYLKGLLKSRSFYDDEQSRFQLDASKFQPDYSKIPT